MTKWKREVSDSATVIWEHLDRIDKAIKRGIEEDDGDARLMSAFGVLEKARDGVAEVGAYARYFRGETNA